MKTLLLILSTFIFFAFAPQQNCGDGAVYANKKQTELDKRFDSYPKIKGVPKFKDGEKKLQSLIQSKLKLSEAAKSMVFNLNYQFTISCDGKVKDVKQIGKAVFNDYTNIVEIIQSTEGEWTPAKNDGKEVDCVYFGTFFINGSQY